MCSDWINSVRTSFHPTLPSTPRKLRGPAEMFRAWYWPTCYLQLPCSWYLAFPVFFQLLHMLFANPFRKSLLPLHAYKKVNVHATSLSLDLPKMLSDSTMLGSIQM